LEELKVRALGQIRGDDEPLHESSNARTVFGTRGVGPTHLDGSGRLEIARLLALAKHDPLGNAATSDPPLRHRNTDSSRRAITHGSLLSSRGL
jgi:hypothetical protein